MKKAVLFTKKKNNVVRCTACNHFCIISPGETGICGVRQNRDGELYLLIYGLTSGVQIDPIEKKPLFHFLPKADVFSIGTIGCNFACDFCQNAWMSQCTKDDTIECPPLAPFPPEKIVNYCIKKDIPIIAYTFNEPAIFFEYTLDTAKLAHKKGIKNIYISNGYESKKAIDLIAPYLDGINIDLKAFTEEFYRKRCKAKLQPVLDNIKHYHEKGIWIEITTLIIPGENDSTQELQKIAKFIAEISPSIPWHITKFSPAYKMEDTPETPEETLHRAHEIGKKTGLKYVYAGNIVSEDLHSTYCPKCSTIVIQRDWGYVKVANLKNGNCLKCGTKIEGVWS